MNERNAPQDLVAHKPGGVLGRPRQCLFGEQIMQQRILESAGTLRRITLEQMAL